jgi:hypothetical protein
VHAPLEQAIVVVSVPFVLAVGLQEPAVPMAADKAHNNARHTAIARKYRFHVCFAGEFMTTFLLHLVSIVCETSVVFSAAAEKAPAAVIRIGIYHKPIPQSKKKDAIERNQHRSRPLCAAITYADFKHRG